MTVSNETKVALAKAKATSGYPEELYVCAVGVCQSGALVKWEIHPKQLHENLILEETGLQEEIE